MPALRPPASGPGTGRRRRPICLLLVAMCVLPAAVHCTSAKGVDPGVPPRHRPFALPPPSPSPPPSASPAPPPAPSPATAVVTPASHHLDPTLEHGRLPRTHRRRSAEEENDLRCRDFTVGTPEDNSLRSPFFPNTYPNNTDCVRILDAGPGHVVRLEFREMFRMEPSDGCQFDFVEARDGRYGYNEVLARLCGQRPPSGVMSSGRYMYLHFHSDDTIEYEGFAAVYIILPRPTQMSPSPGPGPELSPCIIHVTGVEGYVNRTDIDRHCPERLNQSLLWHSPLEGMWIVNVTIGWKIQMAFLSFKLEKPNDCNQNFVQLFKDNTDIPSRLSEFCGAKAETMMSENNVMHLRYWATPQAINSTFEALFTAYREGNKKPCLEDEFDCQDDTCISRTLRCNGRVNCRFLWDEEKEECKKSVSMMKEILSSDHIIIILVIFCLILSGMCFAFLYNCTRKLVRDHRIIREHVRASREARLDAAGKLTPGGSVAALRSAGTASRRPSGGGTGGGALQPDGGGGTAAAGGGACKSPRARSAPDDCYVPAGGGLLPVLLRDTPAPDTQLPPPPPLNGDAVFLRDARRRDGSSASPRLFDDDDDEEEDDGMEQDEVDLCDYLGPAPEMRDNECQTRESLFLTGSFSATTATSTASPASDQTGTPPPPPPPPPSAALLASRAAAATAPGVGGHAHSQSGSSTEAGRAPPPLPPGPSPAASTFSTFGHHPHRHRHPGSSASPAQPTPDLATLPLRHHHQHHHEHQLQHQPHHHHHHRHHYGQPQPSAPPPPAVPPAPSAEQRFRAEAVIEVENGRGLGRGQAPGADPSRPYSVQSTKSAPDVIVTH